MNVITDEHNTTVSALTTSEKDQTPPVGKTWEVVRFFGSAAFRDDTTVSLIWDRGGAGETVVALTHGSMERGLGFQCPGDGAKKLAIVLQNDSDAAQQLGGAYEVKEFDS